MERRDIWSVRDLKKKHIPWLLHMRQKLLDATVSMYPTLERDQLKLYVHCECSPSTEDLLTGLDQPTYYHFHIHIVHVELEAGATQATGKALGLENIISQLETISGNLESGMSEVSFTYFLGEANEIWTEIFLPLKNGTMR